MKKLEILEGFRRFLPRHQSEKAGALANALDNEIFGAIHLQQNWPKTSRRAQELLHGGYSR